VGSGITPYAVPLARLRASCGSKKQALIAAVRRECEGLIFDLDESFRNEIAYGAPDAGTAVAQLVDGAFGAKRSGAFMYAYALELLCAHLGTKLDAPVLQRTSTALLKLVDGALRAQGVDAFTTRDLTSGHPPVKLPPRAALPGVGTIEPAVVALASRQMAKLEISESDVPHGERAMREAARGAIVEIGEWMETARATRGGGLVCFYY